MISLRKTATELDRLEELHRTAVQCYSEALHSSGQNAVELDSAQAARFRAQLEALRDRLRADAGRSELEAVQTSFSNELREYHDRTRDQVQRLKQEVQAAAAAVESFAGSITESEATLESGIQRELNSLKKGATGDDIQQMRATMLASADKIDGTVQQMRSSNQLAIAQLKDEIRLLHREVQEARRAQTPDSSEESRRFMTSRMEQIVQKKSTFSVLLVVLRNLEGLQNCYSEAMVDSALRGFQSRFENILPSTALVERWAKDQFAAILSSASGDAIEMSSEVVRRLSEPFPAQEKGVTQSVTFNPGAGVVEFSPGSDLAKFQLRLKQLADALAG